jgi:hypothetical protein
VFAFIDVDMETLYNKLDICTFIKTVDERERERETYACTYTDRKREADKQRYMFLRI